MVSISYFSGLESSHCALASAAASAAIDSPDRRMASLRFEDVEADCARFRVAGPDPVPYRLLGVLRNEPLELGLGLVVLGMGVPGPQKDAGEFRPAVRGASLPW